MSRPLSPEQVAGIRAVLADVLHRLATERDETPDLSRVPPASLPKARVGGRCEQR